MSSLSPSSKRPQGQAAHGVDRLSSLPDPLLHLVMSFLPMPEVVRTSLLSPRWRYLWASVPFIHLDYMDFVDDDDDHNDDDDDHNDDDDDDDYAYACWEKVDQSRLQMFGDHLLLLRDGTLPLDEARIFIKDGGLYDNCCTWIRHAIRHKARLLHVNGPFTGVIFDDRSMIPSQHLKRIRLQTVTLTRISFSPLNFDFPVLEHLELEHCNIWDITLKISSRSLKTINISCCHFSGDLEICALNLNHLSILDPVFRYSEGRVIETRDLYSLVTASISLRCRVRHGNQDKIWNHGMLDGLSHVTALELHAPLPEPTLEKGLQTCPVFRNLTNLVLGEWCMASNFAPLLFILRRSPKLKDLTFKLKMEQHGACKAAECDLSPREESSSDRYPSIKRIVIYCSKDDPGVGTLVKVLLLIVIPAGEISIKGHQ